MKKLFLLLALLINANGYCMHRTANNTNDHVITIHDDSQDTQTKLDQIIKENREIKQALKPSCQHKLFVSAQLVGAMASCASLFFYAPDYFPQYFKK